MSESTNNTQTSESRFPTRESQGDRRNASSGGWGGGGSSAFGGRSGGGAFGDRRGGGREGGEDSFSNAPSGDRPRGGAFGSSRGQQQGGGGGDAGSDNNNRPSGSFGGRFGGREDNRGGDRERRTGGGPDRQQQQGGSRTEGSPVAADFERRDFGDRSGFGLEGSSQQQQRGPRGEGGERRGGGGGGGGDRRGGDGQFGGGRRDRQEQQQGEAAPTGVVAPDFERRDFGDRSGFGLESSQQRGPRGEGGRGEGNTGEGRRFGGGDRERFEGGSGPRGTARGVEGGNAGERIEQTRDFGGFGGAPAGERRDFAGFGGGGRGGDRAENGGRGGAPISGPPVISPEEAANNRFMVAAADARGSNTAASGPVEVRDFRGFGDAVAEGDAGEGGGRRAGGAFSNMRQNNNMEGGEEEQGRGPRRFGGGGMDRDGGGGSGPRRFGGGGMDRDGGGDRGDGSGRRFPMDRDGGGDRGDGGGRRFPMDRDGGGDRGDRRSGMPFLRPMDSRGDRAPPASAQSVQARKQVSIMALIDKDGTAASASTAPATSVAAAASAAAAAASTPTTMSSAAYAAKAASLGDDVAEAALRKGINRILDDYLASFAKDAAKKYAIELATLTNRDKKKVIFSVHEITGIVAALASASSRKQLSSFVNALRVGTKKDPAAAGDEEVSLGLESGLASFPPGNDARLSLFAFLDDIVSAKNGLPVTALGPVASALYQEKPVPVLDASALLEGAMDGAGASWGDSAIEGSSSTSTSTSSSSSSAATRAGTTAPASTAASTRVTTTTASTATTTTPSSAAVGAGAAEENLAALTDVVAQVLATGKLGQDLVTEAKDATSKYSKVESAGSLTTAVLKTLQSKGQLTSKCSWLADTAYGALFREFIFGKMKASQAFLFALQAYFSELGFPLGDKGIPLLLRIFEVIYDRDLITEDALHAWRDDIRNPAPGHDKALMQTQEFFEWLENAEEEEDDDEDEGDQADDDISKTVVKPDNRAKLR